MNLSTFQGLDVYDPQDIDTEVLLSEMPLNIIMGSIEGQFKDPESYNGQDFVQSFITKYQVTQNTYTEDADFEELEMFYNQFILFMEHILQEKLNVGIPDLEDMGKDEQLEILHYIYRFFVINIKKNFSKFIRNYIESERDALAVGLPKRKDVSSNSLKTIIEDPVDFAIITNIGTVIDLILANDEITVDEFLEMSRGDSANLENDYITDHYETFAITGNFVPRYGEMLTEELRIQLECKVRNKLLKKYRKK